MCLIIHNPKNKTVPLEVFENALMMNPDGFGIFFHDTGEIRRTMDWQKPYEWISEDRPYTCHFRYATSGPVKKANCHPFSIDKRYSLMMNGTIERLKSTKTVDTEELCKILKSLDEERIVAILRTYACRFALLNKLTGEVTIINHDLWTKQGGILYSKANCLPDNKSYRIDNYKPFIVKKPAPAPITAESLMLEEEWADWVGDWPEDPKNWATPQEEEVLYQDYKDEDVDDLPEMWEHTVAVYGTLKQGHGNHKRHLTTSYYLGEGRTVENYPLVVDGLPYLIDRSGVGHRVKVEVYRVSNNILKGLDSLESHPQWYKREQIKVSLDKGSTVTAWVYMIPDTKSTTHMNDTGVYVDSF